MSKYIVHPLIRDGCVEERLYQVNIANMATRKNSLVVLPTGLGKTVIAVLVAAERISKNPDGKCFILAPTKPLTLQHYGIFKSLLTLQEDDFLVLTGESPPAKRSVQQAKIIFMTPQILENDLIAGRVNLEDIALIVFDEAHRAVGNYAYVFIAERYMKQAKNPLILGLTASPGASRDKIKEITRNLAIQHVEIRTERSLDVKPYIKPIKVKWLEIELVSPFKDIKFNLDSFIREKISNLRKAGFLEKNEFTITYSKFSKIRDAIRARYAENLRPSAESQSAMLDLMYIHRASYALGLLETQGLSVFNKYFEKLKTQAQRAGGSLSAKRILLDGRIQEAISLGIFYGGKGFEHPKVDKLLEVVKESFAENARRIIVFTNYRETSKKLVEKLNLLPNVSAVRLIGQSDRPADFGLSQKEQHEVLEDFKVGRYNVLVATQVAEEGIDISASDVVVFYDTVPSAIRFIQRRGRTGRKSPGKVFILITKATRDSAYYYIAKRKERMMMDIINELQDAKTSDLRQSALESFTSSKVEPEAKSLTIIADARESGSPVVKELIKFNVDVKLKSIPVGDYVISEMVAVERKTAADLALSIKDKRLFIQVKQLASEYAKPVLIIEGNLYSSGFSAEAIRGAILSVMLDFRVPIIFTKDPVETAIFLLALTEREQREKSIYISIRGEKKPLSLKEQQEYVVASLPHVELATARKLLAVFGSVEKIFTASIDELKNVPGIGNIKADKIRKIIEREYQAEN